MLPLCFTLNNTKTDFIFSHVTVRGEFSMSWFSLSKLPSKKKTNDTNSRHAENIYQIGTNSVYSTEC